MNLVTGERVTLVIMAAGMGSRYKGLKQIDPVGPAGEVIMEYSIYDALQAGFEEVVVVLKPGMGEDFHRLVGERISRQCRVRYAYQEMERLPDGYLVPEGRVKPWGTAQAVLAARDQVTGPFAVINADDYYGAEGFRVIAEFLSQGAGDKHLAMVGYRLENTLTEHGTVARGVCEVDAGRLVRIDERTQIMKTATGPAYSDDDGLTWIPLPGDTPVSMNLWGFPRAFFDQIEAGFAGFLDENLIHNPLKCEYLLPSVVQAMIDSGAADVTVLSSPDRWFGVTYRQDKPGVVAMIAAKHDAGAYPTPLWGRA